MKGGVAYYLVGAGVLLALAGCGRSMFMGERAPWRHQAEVECMKSGVVKLGAGVVRMEPIEGPGMCGADFPLKVAVLGEGAAAIGYGDDLRPPGSIPNASQMPNWPVNEPRYAPPVGRVDSQPMSPQSPPPNMRWAPGPPPAVHSAPMGSAGRSIELSPTGIA
ncbi:MAG: extensin, partial [Pseudolabrys sp.]